MHEPIDDERDSRRPRTVVAVFVACGFMPLTFATYADQHDAAASALEGPGDGDPAPNFIYVTIPTAPVSVTGSPMV